MKAASILLALAGIAVAAGLLALADAGAVWAATVSVGWGGFALLLLWQGATFLLLAAAWRVVLPGVRWRSLVWGRMVRDAATTCLPFSPVGGFVIGARALAIGLRGRGVPWPVAAAGTAVDATAEVAGQVLFALFGVGVVLGRAGPSGGGPLVAGALAALAVLVGGLWQRRRIGAGLRALGRRLLGHWCPDGGGLERLGAELGAELSRAYRPRRLGLATIVHLCGWFATGLGTWVSLRLLGAGAAVVPVLALEALLDGLLGAAFVVPGGAGVQEAGYVGIGALFGVPADLALSASLLRRGKDLAWGVPILAAWQWREVRRLAG